MKERPILFSGPMVRAILAGAKTQTRRVVTARHPLTHIGPRGSEDSPDEWGYFFDGPDHHGYMVLGRGHNDRHDHGLVSIPCPYGVVGDRLWVREKWRTYERPTDGVDGICFAADDAFVRIENTSAAADRWVVAHDNGDHGEAWRSPIFMPRWASRLTLEITDIRVQRLQEIGAADACDEGAAEVLEVGHALRAECYAKHGTWTGDEKRDIDGPFAGAVAAFATLWDEINGNPQVTLDDDGAPVLDDNDRPIRVATRSWASNPWVWAITFKHVETR